MMWRVLIVPSVRQRPALEEDECDAWSLSFLIGFFTRHSRNKRRTKSENGATCTRDALNSVLHR